MEHVRRGSRILLDLVLAGPARNTLLARTWVGVLGALQSRARPRRCRLVDPALFAPACARLVLGDDEEGWRAYCSWFEWVERAGVLEEPPAPCAGKSRLLGAVAQDVY
jgi:hypothetical protein